MRPSMVGLFVSILSVVSMKQARADFVDDLVSICQGGQCSNIPGTVRALDWRIALRDHLTTQVTTVSSDTSTYDIDVDFESGAIVLEYENIESPNLPAGIELEVDVRIGFGGDLFLVSLKLDARIESIGESTHSISSVTFPVVDVNATAEYDLTWPIGTGAVLENVLSHPLAFLPTNFYRHPGPASMQWWCLYNGDPTCWSPSFYMSTQDQTGVYKEYLPASLGDAMRFTVRHVPPDSHTITEYEQPFKTVIGTTFDDWWSAAQRYAHWANDQQWTSQGTMRDDPNFSDAVRDMTMFGIFSPDATVLSWQPWLARHFEQTTLFGTPFIVPQNYGWYGHQFNAEFGNWEPLAEYVTIAGQAAAAGIRFSPYTLLHLISAGSEPDVPGYAGQPVSNFTVVRENGTLQTTLDGQGQVAYEICQSTQYARDYAAWLAAQLKSYGASGMYIDLMNASPAQLCFSTSHGHAPVDPLNTQRRIEMTRGARQAMGDEFYVTSESVNEFFLGEVGIGTSQWVRNVLGEVVSYYPLFDTVYHEYMRVGRLGVALNFANLSLPPLAFQLLSRQTYAAHIFMGYTPFAGSLMNPNSLIDNTLFSPIWGVFIDTIARYMNFITQEDVSAHLMFGERLRDPVANVATIDLGFLGAFLRLLEVPYGTVQPAVYISSWGDPEEGSILILLANWTDPLDNILVNTVATQSTMEMDMSAEALGFDPLWFEEYNQMASTKSVDLKDVEPIAFQGGDQPYSFSFKPIDSGYWAPKWKVWHMTSGNDPVFIGSYLGFKTIQLAGTIPSRRMEAYILKPFP